MTLSNGIDPPEPTPPAPNSDDEGVIDLAAAAPVGVPCWRCSLELVPGVPECPRCLARQSWGPLHPTAHRRPTATQTDQYFLKLFLFFFALLAVQVVYRWITNFGIEADGEDFGAHFQAFAIFSIVDAVLIAVGAVVLARRLPQKRTGRRWRWVAWLVAGPVLAGLLFVNWSYHNAIQSYLGVEPNVLKPSTPVEYGLSIFFICVMPAIFEEWFFRGLVLGALRQSTHRHLAVLLSSVMFAVAHLGALVSMPYLALCGLVFGYARLATGRLWLPMLMHFVHNLVVVLWMQAS